jgi:hypothetical protein
MGYTSSFSARENLTSTVDIWSSSSMQPVFLKNSKIMFESFKKIGTKILEIDNYEIYYCAKNES